MKKSNEKSLKNAIFRGEYIGFIFIELKLFVIQFLFVKICGLLQHFLQKFMDLRFSA